MDTANDVANSLRECISAMEAYEEARKSRLNRQIEFGQVLERIYARKLASKAKIAQLIADTNNLVKSLNANATTENLFHSFQSYLSSASSQVLKNLSLYTTVRSPLSHMIDDDTMTF